VTLPLVKYPRTRHIQGSRLQRGDQDLEAAPFAEIRDRHLVVEEKIDGSNAAIRFDSSRRLHLQSRGHYLAGGPRERLFALLKSWAHAHASRLAERLGDRHILYGEWVHAKHTIFYDSLPHYFLEFDVLDTAAGEFLSTPRRRELLAGLPIASVPVLAEGTFDSLDGLTSLVGPSKFKTPNWRAALLDTAGAVEHVDVDRTVEETDPTLLMEGLYLKVEEDGRVAGRYKFIRESFLSGVIESESHWVGRPIVRNLLAPGVDIFSPALLEC
jgi:hypothetical protein